MIRIHLLVQHEQAGCIAETKLVWTGVIFNSRRLVNHLQTVGCLTCIARLCIKIFWRPKRGFEQTPLNPPAYGPELCTMMHVRVKEATTVYNIHVHYKQFCVMFSHVLFLWIHKPGVQIPYTLTGLGEANFVAAAIQCTCSLLPYLYTVTSQPGLKKSHDRQKFCLFEDRSDGLRGRLDSSVPANF